MKDITAKSNTLRSAIAQATVVVSMQETIDAINNNAVEKGNVFEMAKAAGLLGIKKTPDLLPDCHPIPIEHAAIEYEIEGLNIVIEVTVKTIYKTGVEVEAMHGASVVALTIYDMLKPIDKGIEIHAIKLLEKKGGKSQYKQKSDLSLTAAVMVSSDSVSKGTKEDKAGVVVKEKLEKLGVDVKEYIVLPDEPEQIRAKTEEYCAAGINMVVITGGTGLSPRDHTPEALKPIIDREIPGVMEASRSYGQNRTPYAMLSRGIAGMKGNTLILGIPGSTKGAAETIDALFPAILHIFVVQDAGFKH